MSKTSDAATGQLRATGTAGAGRADGAVTAEAPRPERRPLLVRRPFDEVEDPYAWIRDRDDPAVRAHLTAENDYVEASLAHTRPLQDQLFSEIRGRVQEDDASAPARRGDWWYLARTEQDRSYSIHCRRRGGPDGPEEVWLDENQLAEGHEYFALGGASVSPDQRLAAYSVDTDGSEVFTLRIRDLDTGEDRPDEIARASYSLAWYSNSAALLYTVPDDAMRPHQVWRHVVGTEAADDQLVFQEDDPRFYLRVSRTRSGELLVIELHSAITSEAWILDADDPDDEPRLVAERITGEEYHLDHRGELLYIVTNSGGATDFKVVTAPVDAPGRDRWADLIGPREGVKVEGVDAFESFIVVYERAEATVRIRIVEADALAPVADTGTAPGYVIEQPEDVYSAGPGRNHEFDTDLFRYGYTSLVTPPSTYDYSVSTRSRTLIKQRPVLGGYDADDYVTLREWATASDGTRIPIAVVHRRDVQLGGNNPTLLYGYGAYAASMDPAFSSARLSLLDRGFVFAIGHVRGGGEMGRSWYEQGKFEYKPNTFTDFVACAEHLVEAGYTRPERLAIRGGSAGGLLIGATLNLRPELFAAAVAEVPFVDVLNTMLDESLPLTAIEWEEWGDPREAEPFKWMKAYAPYENVRAVDYPAMLVTAGLNDPRVGYWEPAKWVALIRERQTGSRPVLLKTELGAGHGGRSGRYDAWRDEALVFAFLIDRLEAHHTSATSGVPNDG